MADSGQAATDQETDGAIRLPVLKPARVVVCGNWWRIEGLRSQNVFTEQALKMLGHVEIALIGFS